MARNASGAYTLPSGNPVVTGTTITSTWGNATMSDVATEMTDSLSRTGKGGMLAPLKTINGTAGAPVYTFTNFPTSGWYIAGAGDVRMAITGVDRLKVLATGVEVIGNITAELINPALIAVKEADESVTSSTTLQDDDALQLTLAANSFYKLEAHLTVFSASANPDFKYRFEFGAVGNWSGLKEDADQSTGFDINQTTNAITKTLSAGVATTIIVNIQMEIGGGAGPFKLRWAQNTSDGTATTVKAGSFMKAEKLA
jgi:hypothetical protein